MNILIKKRYLFLILMVCLFAVSAVSAAENITDDIDSVAETTDNVVSVEENQTILQGNNAGTFTDLASEISKAKSELNLNRNYIYSDSDSDYNYGIIIDKKITINGNGFEINGNNQARAFNINAGSVVLNNISFVNCAVSSSSSSSSSSISESAGGAINWTGSNGKMVNCNFVNSSSYSDSYCYNSTSAPIYSYSESYSYSSSCGGAVFWSGSNGKLVNCNFVNSSTYSNSYSYSSSYSYHTENQSSCYSYGYSAGYSISCGGAVYWCGSNGELVDCSFVNSSSSGSSTSRVRVYSSTTDSKFGYGSHSDSISRGGAVYLAISNCNLINCSFANSYTFSESSSTVYRSDPRSSSTSSSGSSCDSEGGAVYLQGDNSVLTNCSFANCSVNSSSSGSEGGAVYLKGDDNILTDCSFIDCISKEFGGALSGVDGLVKNSVFISNSAGDAGGAIEWGGSAVNCTFINNNARYGGAILSSEAVNCIFINNSANDDGGAACHVDAVNCTFIDNNARWGGAISGYSDAQNCIFFNNFADLNGGAIHFSEGSAVDCIFQDNYANSCGGAISSSCDNYYTNNIKNCIFVNNIADEDGGAIYVEYGGCYVVNCNFQNNHAEGYAGAIYEGSADSCIFSENTAGVEGNDTYETELFKPVLSVSDFTSTYKSSEKLLINFTSSEGVPIANANVKIDVYKNSALIGTYYCLSGDGWVVDLGLGTYVAVVNVDSGYGIDSADAILTVNKAGSIISAPNVNVAYNDPNGELVATITNDHGKPLVVNLNVNFNGKDYTLRTDSNGQASIAIGTLKPGTYTTTISYKGSSNYKASTATAKVTVTKSATVISAPKVNIAYKDPSAELVATIVNEHGKPLVVSLNIGFNGKTYTVKTDSNGQATISIPTLTPGTYTATISYKGSSNYKASTATARVTVTKSDTLISASDVNIAYKDPSGELLATITNEHGKPLVVNLNIGLNGKTYTVRTDSNGQATLSIPTLTPGTYTATISYKGSSNYKASTATAKVTVTKSDTVISAPNVNIAYKDPNGELAATITNEHGKPLVVTLNINLNGKDYTVKTDSNGQASLAIDTLKPGTYTATISYKGSSNYKASSTTAKVTVTKSATLISAPDVSVSYGDPNGKLVSTITNEHGKPLVVNLNVDLNGKTYTAKTDSNGQISVSTADLAPGTYTATISYKGSSNYKSTSTTANIIMKK